MAKTTNKISLPVRSPADAEAEERKLQALRAALIEGENSGEAEPGSFDRARALIRELAAAGRSR